MTLSFTDIGKSRPSYDFLTSEIRLLTLFAQIKFSRKFPNLQFMVTVENISASVMGWFVQSHYHGFSGES